MKTIRRSRSAFTLLEIMLVVSIIALLLAAGIWATRGNLEFGQEVRVEGDIKTLTTQLRLYYASNGFYPSTGQGLDALVAQPESEPRPRRWRKLMDKKPVDPWGNDYVYTSPGSHNADSFDLFSKGPDRQEGTADDIGNWETGK
jgi:general secretion pathway protein G